MERKIEPHFQRSQPKIGNRINVRTVKEYNLIRCHGKTQRQT